VVVVPILQGLVAHRTGGIPARGSHVELLTGEQAADNEKPESIFQPFTPTIRRQQRRGTAIGAR